MLIKEDSIDSVSQYDCKVIEDMDVAVRPLLHVKHVLTLNRAREGISPVTCHAVLLGNRPNCLTFGHDDGGLAIHRVKVLK